MAFRKVREAVISASSLEELQLKAEADPSFSQRETGRYVGGVGNQVDPIAFVVGEAPGATEELEGEPFVGVSGAILAQLMEMAGLYARPVVSADHPETQGLIEPNVWLTNAYKWRPDARNRAPHFGEILAAQPYLRREWALVGRPRLLMAVGSVAATALGIDPVFTPRGSIYGPRQGGIYYAMQYHPAYGLRGGDDRKEMMERHWENLGAEIEELIREGSI